MVWENPEVITTSAKRPDVSREVKTFEVYPGTANVLSDDGLTWNNDCAALLSPETNVAARYYSASTVPIDDQHVGTVFVNGGVHFLKVSLDRMAKQPATQFDEHN